MGNDHLTERLIEIVKKNPIVYDMSLPEYKNSCQKKLVWEAIAKELGGKSGEAICWKWKNLRDSYAKHKKIISTPDEGTGQRFVNWRWAPFMTFLDGHFRKPRGLAADPEEAEEPIHSYIEQPIDTSTGNREIPDLIQGSSSSGFYTITRNRKRKDESNELLMESYQQESASSEKLDKIDYLFLNYAETFKKLTPRRQALLKLQMAKMFAEAELQELERNPIKLEPPEEIIIT